MQATGPAVPIAQVRAIDVHGHYGIWHGRDETLARLSSADAMTVADRARRANIELTVVSPLSALMPRFHADAFAGNEEAAAVVAATPGLLQWVVINPLDRRTYEQAQRMLGTPKCVGIKIHPEEHGYPIRAHGREIFQFAQENSAVILTHSGEERSLPMDFVPFADAFPDVALILAHIGCTCDDDLTHQVRAIQAGRRGNIFADTSSGRSILANLIEWAVREVGAEKVLFGTDTPAYCTMLQRARIDHAQIADEHKRLILRDNAIRLLRLARLLDPGRGV